MERVGSEGAWIMSKKERGLVLAPNLRAKSRIGEKTNTRRLNGLAKFNKNPGEWIYSGPNCDGDHLFVEKQGVGCSGCITGYTHIAKPQCQVGDHLYLQEPYQILNCLQAKHKLHGRYIDTDETFWVEVSEHEWDLWMKRKKPYRKTSSRFMYMGLARTWFEVTDVRVERLQDISGEDVLAEGLDLPEPPINATDTLPFPDGFEKWDKEKKDTWFTDAARTMVFAQYADIENCFKIFENLWDSTNKIKWADNPWVFVYTYKKIEKE